MKKIYFYTATILDWKLLLKQDEFKSIIINSLDNLSSRDLIKVYGFVIMPNHIHLIWEMLKYNGKETPCQSFMKYTAHEYKKLLLKLDEDFLESFKVDKTSRDYQFWKRDPLAIELYSREVLEQKLDYIHANPIQEKWKLCDDPMKYLYSSASFYELNDSKYKFLIHYLDRI